MAADSYSKSVLALIVTLLLSVWASAGPELPALALVDRFDDSHIGYAGSASPNYDAFRAEYGRGNAARPVFEKILEKGTPAARIYAAIGLYGLDKTRGMEVLQEMKADKAPVTAMSGCMQWETTVGELVTELLADDAQGLRGYLPRAEK